MQIIRSEQQFECYSNVIRRRRSRVRPVIVTNKTKNIHSHLQEHKNKSTIKLTVRTSLQT